MKTITKTRDLNAACKELAKAPFVTVDTEFMRETTFWPNLCLIQMASPDGDAVLIDTLSDIDLTAFFGLMANEKVMKVFHAARQDLEIIYKLGGLIPAPLFDTQVAAAVCGFGESIGYEPLIRQITGHGVDKSSQFTDWSLRPLDDKQLAYAADDVIHLSTVYPILAEKIEKARRTEWIAEEMAILISPETYRQSPADAWKRLKMKAKNPLEFALTRRLAEWREHQAQERNVPRNRVLKDDAIHEIAQRAPKDVEALGRLRSIGRGFERSQQGKEILKVIGSVLALPKKSHLPIPRRNGPERAPGPAADMLKVLLRHISDKNNVAARMIASAGDVEAIAADSNADVPALKGWRREMFGERALAFKRGELAIALSGEGIVVEEREPPVTIEPVKQLGRRQRRRVRSR